MSENNYTAINAMVDIIASPSKAFDNIRGHVAWMWWPILAVMACNIALFVWFYSFVDFDWFIEEQIRALPPEQQAEAAESMRSFMSPGIMMLFSIGGLVIGLMVFYLIQTTYLHLVSKLGNAGEFKFGDWFCFSAFAWFPGIFSSIAAMAMIAMAGSNKVSVEALSPLSLNSLFLHLEQGDPGFNFYNSLNLTTLWIIALLAIGYSRWTGASMGKSIIVAAAPYVVIYGAWALTL